MTIARVGVLGAGNIGTGVITDLVIHGISAVVVDVSEEILQRAQANVLKNVRCVPLISKTLLRITKEEADARMVFTTDMRDVATVSYTHLTLPTNREV